MEKVGNLVLYKENPCIVCHFILNQENKKRGKESQEFIRTDLGLFFLSAGRINAMEIGTQK